MKIFWQLFFVILSLLYLFNQSFASNQELQQLNYFASLRADEVNVRAGPSTNYDIKFIYHHKSMPVKVIATYDQWNEIQDFELQTGWVSKNLLTKKRTIMINSKLPNISMHKDDNDKSKIIFYLQDKVIGKYQKCTSQWCEITINGKNGWVKKEHIYGAD
jgi:SH3-like domain-containing protein